MPPSQSGFEGEGGFKVERGGGETGDVAREGGGGGGWRVEASSQLRGDEGCAASRDLRWTCKKWGFRSNLRSPIPLRTPTQFEASPFKTSKASLWLPPLKRPHFENPPHFGAPSPLLPPSEAPPLPPWEGSMGSTPTFGVSADLPAEHRPPWAPPGLHTTTRELQTRTKHQQNSTRRPQKQDERKKLWRETEKCAKLWAPPPFGAPFFQVPGHPSGPHPSVLHPLQ